MPGEDLPEIRNVSSGDTRPRAVLTDDTINQQFLFWYPDGALSREEGLFPEERGNLAWGDTDEMDGQESKITARFTAVDLIYCL